MARRPALSRGLDPAQATLDGLDDGGMVLGDIDWKQAFGSPKLILGWLPRQSEFLLCQLRLARRCSPDLVRNAQVVE